MLVDTEVLRSTAPMRSAIDMKRLPKTSRRTGSSSASAGDALPAPMWGPLQPDCLKGPADLGGAQRWETRRDLGADAVTFDGTKEEHQQLDAATRLHSRHHYRASVSARRPDAARMQSTTEVRIERPVGQTELSVTTLTTTYHVAVTATITIDGSPFWTRTWTRSRPS